MTRRNEDFDPGLTPAVGEQVTSVAADALWLVDLLLEGLVSAATWIGKAINKARPRRRRSDRPLQVIGAMTMVHDHVLRDVGRERAAIGAIGVLSVEEIDGCRAERHTT